MHEKLAFHLIKSHAEVKLVRAQRGEVLLRTCCCPSKAMEDLARRAATRGRAKPRRAREVPRSADRDMASRASAIAARLRVCRVTVLGQRLMEEKKEVAQMARGIGGVQRNGQRSKVCLVLDAAIKQCQYLCLLFLVALVDR